ncbi:dihydrolipoyl dehydrogenase family protein [Nocardioides perillae]|uniref:Pyruvate/2-oxoglutarate dehydrogenase complex dihydrolipoamide dehydrogenase (E3) component n=1 Tax=Nocardioides perillae TaxID=1119534 RepID=A0A7Y9USM7_9ACTN|nr:NAD(P)/FAD-dependent oxidoreductase [Nocardioides perillae]NYG56069.1 pyruvate/2-oxoglutarate dehydrogenase complex dihydrolipoamide dehydrogenase (E3) component [Nocardioides perillae]
MSDQERQAGGTGELTEEVDLVVVGLGPGGEALAQGAAEAGLSVVAVDKHLVGGECPYYGCIPTKMMVRGSDALAEVRRAPEVAGEASGTPDWSVVARRIRDEATSDWDDRAAADRLRDAGATVLHGTARLAGPGRVEVEGADGTTTTYRPRRGTVLNPGTRPSVPPVDGLAGTPYWTNREAVRATEVPRRLVVLGGGPIGCELAQVFARFGSEVTVVDHGPRLLGPDEPEAGELLGEVFADEGITVLHGASLIATRHDGSIFTSTVEVDGDTREVVSEALLVAAGRTPNLDDLGLDTVGLDPGARTVPVDDRMRVEGVEGLWAVGDVVGHGAWTHVSMYQQDVALADLLGRDGPPARYHAVPHVTFTDPEVAGVGMTEHAAREAGLPVQVGRSGLGSRGFTHGAGARGFVKVVADADRGVLVGATVVGPAGGEVLGLLALAVHAEVPLATLRSMVLAFPTFHRAIGTAVGDLA